MGAPIIIEVLDRFGRVKERHKTSDFPLKVGRSYQNDIIIDDQFISPEHIEIIKDGNNQLLVRDLKSTNGLLTLSPLRKHDVIEVKDNQRIRIGHTDIRIRTAEFPVHEAYIDKVSFSKTRLILSHILFMPAVLLTTFVFLFTYYFQQSYVAGSSSSYASEILSPFMLIMFWTLLWATISKIVTHKFNIVAIVSSISIAIIAYYLLDLLEYIEFSTHMSLLVYILDLVLYAFIVMLLLYATIRFSTLASKHRAWVNAVFAGLFITVFAELLNHVYEPDYTATPQFSSYVKHPSFVLSTPVSVDEFLDETSQLKSRFTITASDNNTDTNNTAAQDK